MIVANVMEVLTGACLLAGAAAGAVVWSAVWIDRRKADKRARERLVEQTITLTQIKHCEQQGRLSYINGIHFEHKPRLLQDRPKLIAAWERGWFAQYQESQRDLA